MALWEFEGDLEAHYKSGPANEITTMAPHKLFNEIHSLIDFHEIDDERPDETILTFGHSGGIQPIINAFEIFRDDRNLGGFERKKQKKIHNGSENSENKKKYGVV